MQISWLNSYADQPVKTGEKTLGARVVPKKLWDQNCCERLRNCKLFVISLISCCLIYAPMWILKLDHAFCFGNLHTWNCGGKYKKRWNILENWQAPDHCVRHCVRLTCNWAPQGESLQATRFNCKRAEPGRVSLQAHLTQWLGPCSFSYIKDWKERHGYVISDDFDWRLCNLRKSQKWHNILSKSFPDNLVNDLWHPLTVRQLIQY
jgi:hypothetical protein